MGDDGKTFTDGSLLYVRKDFNILEDRIC